MVSCLQMYAIALNECTDDLNDRSSLLKSCVIKEKVGNELKRLLHSDQLYIWGKNTYKKEAGCDSAGLYVLCLVLLVRVFANSLCQTLMRYLLLEWIELGKACDGTKRWPKVQHERQISFML